jgi:hypothetical protein
MSFFQRLRDVLGLDDLYDDDYGYEDDGMNSQAYGAEGDTAKNSRKVVGCQAWLRDSRQ